MSIASLEKKFRDLNDKGRMARTEDERREVRDAKNALVSEVKGKYEKPSDAHKIIKEASDRANGVR